MRAKVDLIALQRELAQRIKILRSDTVYLGTPEGERRVQLLAQRQEKVEFIMQNFELIEWLLIRTQISNGPILSIKIKQQTKLK